MYNLDEKVKYYKELNTFNLRLEELEAHKKELDRLLEVIDDKLKDLYINYKVDGKWIDTEKFFNFKNLSEAYNSLRFIRVEYKTLIDLNYEMQM